MEEQDEYRYLHSRMSLKLSWKDWMKLSIGQILRFSFCVRILLVKDDNGKLIDIDTDNVSTTVLVQRPDEEIVTKEAVFSQDELHK